MRSNRRIEPVGIFPGIIVLELVSMRMGNVRIVIVRIMILLMTILRVGIVPAAIFGICKILEFRLQRTT